MALSEEVCVIGITTEAYQVALWCAGKSSIKMPDNEPEEGAMVPECQELQNALLQVCFA